MKPEPGPRSGLVKFRWPFFDGAQWKYFPIEEHPFYSEEQYASDFCDGYANFAEAVAKRIDPTDYDPCRRW